MPAGIHLRLEAPGDYELAYRSRRGRSTKAAPSHPMAFVLLESERRRWLPLTDEPVLRFSIAQAPAHLYLPEPSLPRLDRLLVPDGFNAEPPSLPRVAVYGDSIVQGWSTSDPSQSWTATLGRALPAEVINLGFAGSGRGDLAAASLLAQVGSPAAVILAFGTNCWQQEPITPGLMAERTRALAAAIHRAHPGAVVLVLTPLLRPAAEHVENAAGATLHALRDALASGARRSGGPTRLLDGRELVDESDLVDGVHPDDRGHARIAEAVLRSLRRALDGR